MRVRSCCAVGSLSLGELLTQAATWSLAWTGRSCQIIRGGVGAARISMGDVNSSRECGEQGSNAVCGGVCCSAVHVGRVSNLPVDPQLR